RRRAARRDRRGLRVDPGDPRLGPRQPHGPRRAARRRSAVRGGTRVIRLSGRFRSALIIGLQGIRARKTRTLLSMVSLFLGVLAVVVVQAGAEIATQAALSDIELNLGKDGTRQIYLPPTEQAVPVALETVTGKANAAAVLNTQAIIGEPGVSPINPGGS